MFNIVGYRKSKDRIGLADKAEIIDILKCHLLKITIPEMNQFADGLQSLRVLNWMKKHPDHMKSLFVREEKVLSSCRLCYHIHVHVLLYAIQRYSYIHE